MFLFIWMISHQSIVCTTNYAKVPLSLSPSLFAAHFNLNSLWKLNFDRFAAKKTMEIWTHRVRNHNIKHKQKYGRIDQSSKFRDAKQKQKKLNWLKLRSWRVGVVGRTVIYIKKREYAHGDDEVVVEICRSISRRRRRRQWCLLSGMCASYKLIGAVTHHEYVRQNEFSLLLSRSLFHSHAWSIPSSFINNNDVKWEVLLLLAWSGCERRARSSSHIFGTNHSLVHEKHFLSSRICVCAIASGVKLTQDMLTNFGPEKKNKKNFTRDTWRQLKFSNVSRLTRFQISNLSAAAFSSAIDNTHSHDYGVDGQWTCSIWWNLPKMI